MGGIDMNLKLVSPSVELKESYLEYINEWRDSKEKIVPMSADPNYLKFEDMLEKWDEESTDKVLARRLVPANTYFLVDDNNKIYGSLNFRHYLNDHLQLVGGHIGYGVRPSERKKGIASNMLKLGIDIIKSEHKLDKVLITCDKSNIGSAKTILANGGILENEVIDGDKTIQRYWIRLR